MLSAFFARSRLESTPLQVEPVLPQIPPNPTRYQRPSRYSAPGATDPQPVAPVAVVAPPAAERIPSALEDEGAQAAGPDRSSTEPHHVQGTDDEVKLEYVPFSFARLVHSQSFGSRVKFVSRRAAGFEYRATKATGRNGHLPDLSCPPSAIVGHRQGDLYVHVYAEGVKYWTWRRGRDGLLQWLPVELGEAHPARSTEYVLTLSKNHAERPVWVKWKSARTYRWATNRTRKAAGQV